MNTILDGAGVHGSIIHYSMVICMVGTAFFIFLYLWRKGRLDMDEGPKYKMMEDEENHGR